MRVILTVALVILMIDALGFMLWAVSGQYPTDSAYVGTITAHVLGLVL